MGTTRYSIEDGNTINFDCRLIHITYSKFENDWYSFPHAHPYAELFYVRSGQGSFLIEDKEYPIYKDDFVIINSNVNHTEKSSSSRPLEYVMIAVDGIDFSFEGDQDYIIFSCRNKQKDLMCYMDTMLNEITEKNPHFEKICQNLLEILIIKLIRQTNYAFVVAPTREINRECIKLKRYIEANHSQNITLDTLSELSHWNKYYLVHVFTKHCGCSPIQYLCQIRLQISKELLTTSNFSITEVAQLSGFSSQSYFAQCFRKAYGMTASAYRKSHKKQSEK